MRPRTDDTPALIKTAADAEQATRRVMNDAVREVDREILSIEGQMAAVPVRLVAADDVDTDALIDKAIEAIEAAESEVEQFRPRIERARQAMEDALDVGEYQARQMVIRPALVSEVDRCITQIRDARSARLEQLVGSPPQLSALQSERKNLAEYRTTLAEKRKVVQHFEDGARRACLALVSDAGDAQQDGSEAGR